MRSDRDRKTDIHDLQKGVASSMPFALTFTSYRSANLNESMRKALSLHALCLTSQITESIRGCAFGKSQTFWEIRSV